MSKLKAPFAWIGGKSKLAPEIVARFPEHKRYIEVFGGALNVFYAKEPSKVEVVNDINGDLVNLLLPHISKFRFKGQHVCHERKESKAEEYLQRVHYMVTTPAIRYH